MILDFELLNLKARRDCIIQIRLVYLKRFKINGKPTPMYLCVLEQCKICIVNTIASRDLYKYSTRNGCNKNQTAPDTAILFNIKQYQYISCRKVMAHDCIILE